MIGQRQGAAFGERPARVAGIGGREVGGRGEQQLIVVAGGRGLDPRPAVLAD